MWCLKCFTRDALLCQVFCFWIIHISVTVLLFIGDVNFETDLPSWVVGPVYQQILNVLRKYLVFRSWCNQRTECSQVCLGNMAPQIHERYWYSYGESHLLSRKLIFITGQHSDPNVNLSWNVFLRTKALKHTLRNCVLSESCLLNGRVLGLCDYTFSPCTSALAPFILRVDAIVCCSFTNLNFTRILVNV